MFDYPWTPFDAYRMLGKYFAIRNIYSGLKRRVDPSIFAQGEAEMALFANYIHLMMVRKKSSEICLNRIFMPFAYTRAPLEPLLPQLKSHQVRMAFMYGEFDWVNRQVADDLVEKELVVGEVFQTENSGHHLNIEASEECVACILKFKYGQQLAEEFMDSIVADMP